jgi:hypothetical protein
MRTRNRIRLILTLVACALGVQEGIAQEVRARVVDELSRSAIAGAAATLLTPDTVVIARAVSGPDGFFSLSAPARGDYLVRIEHLGFATVTRSVAVRDGQVTVPAFVLPVTAIPLDTLEVEASRGASRVPGVVGFSRPSHLISGDRMAVLERTGVSFTSAVREIGAGLRSRGVMVGDRNYTCIESVRHTPSMGGGGGGGCAMVAIILDGVNTGMDTEGALRFVHYLRLAEYESVQYLSPVDAGVRYGLRASDRGALVLWTRGKGPFKSEARGGGRSANSMGSREKHARRDGDGAGRDKRP